MTKVTIKATENDPLLVEVDEKTTVVLCGCGKSYSQPSCDGTHAKIGFKAASSEIKVTEQIISIFLYVQIVKLISYVF